MPLFVLLTIGALAKKRRWMSEKGIFEMNNLCLRILFPCLVLRNAMNSDIGKVLNPSMLLYGWFTYAIMVSVMWVVIPRIIKKRQIAGAVIHSAYRGNLMFGVSLAVIMYGLEEAAPISIMASLLVPLSNIMAACLLNSFAHDEAPPLKIGHILRAVATNSLVIASLTGITISYLEITLPLAVVRSISDLGAASVPLAMIALGANIDWKGAMGHLRYSIPATALKLVVFPLLFTAGGIWLGLRGTALAAIYLLHASPTGFVVALFTDQTKEEGKIAGEIVVLTSALSVFTIFVGIFLLKQFALI